MNYIIAFYFDITKPLIIITFLDGFIDIKGTDATMHNKDNVILDKKIPYECNICLYILEELMSYSSICLLSMIRFMFSVRDSEKHSLMIST